MLGYSDLLNRPSIEMNHNTVGQIRLIFKRNMHHQVGKHRNPHLDHVNRSTTSVSKENIQFQEAILAAILKNSRHLGF